MRTDTEKYNEMLQIFKVVPTKFKVPKYIIVGIHEHDLIHIEDENERAKIFLRFLFTKKLKASTVARYYNTIKPYLYKNTTILPNTIVFNDYYDKTFQNRGANIDKISAFIRFVRYNVKDTNIYKWPILISAYSGLRISEVTQLMMRNLSELRDKKPIISIRRKNNENWNVIYYNEFNNIILETINANINKFNLYEHELIDQKLFPFKKMALHVKIKEFYRIANKSEPPKGFGLHTLRNYIATILFEDTKKIEIVQAILNHKNQKTSELYIYKDNTDVEINLNSIFGKNSLYSKIQETLDHHE